MVKYFWATGSGKTHLAKILEKKINKIKLIDAKILNEIIQDLNNLDCLIIDSYKIILMKNYFIQF